jgi:hypothetical protein
MEEGECNHTISSYSTINGPLIKCHSGDQNMEQFDISLSELDSGGIILIKTSSGNYAKIEFTSTSGFSPLAGVSTYNYTLYDSTTLIPLHSGASQIWNGPTYSALDLDTYSPTTSSTTDSDTDLLYESRSGYTDSPTTPEFFVSQNGTTMKKVLGNYNGDAYKLAIYKDGSELLTSGTSINNNECIKLNIITTDMIGNLANITTSAISTINLSYQTDNSPTTVGFSNASDCSSPTSTITTSIGLGSSASNDIYFTAQGSGEIIINIRAIDTTQGTPLESANQVGIWQ